MQGRRKEDQGKLGKFKMESRRYVTLLVMLIIIVGLSFLLPSSKEQVEGYSSQMGILALLITVSLKVTAGVVLAHAFRRGLFPFLDFMTLLRENDHSGVIFLTVWYGVFIWAFAMGG